MDGFDGGIGVVIFVVINRFDSFDKVLFCLGRFDRCILVEFLDFGGCEVILKVYV